MPSASPMIVRYFQGMQETHNAYQFELIFQALEITRDEYGDYRIEPYGLAPNAKRQAILMSEGKLLNLIWGSPGAITSKTDVTAIPIDILKGLLGYRVCLANTEAHADFASIATINDLNNLKIGQGLNWSDAAVYEYNHLNLTEAATLDGLFQMLALKRFGCIALGANEVSSMYRTNKINYPFLTIEPSLLIYYKYPIYLYVSKKTPNLAKRLELGLIKLQKSGAFDRLFNQYYATDLALLNLPKRKVICLKSPYLNEADQCTKPIPYPHEQLKSR